MSQNLYACFTRHWDETAFFRAWAFVKLKIFNLWTNWVEMRNIWRQFSLITFDVNRIISFSLFFCSFDTQPTMYTAQIYYSNTMSCCSPSLSLSPLPQNFNLCGQFQLPQLRWNCVSAIRHRLDECYSNLDKNCLSFRCKLSILCKDKQTKNRSPGLCTVSVTGL